MWPYVRGTGENKKKSENAAIFVKTGSSCTQSIFECAEDITQYGDMGRSFYAMITIKEWTVWSGIFSMKITAGIGTIEDYILYAEAGADEMFAGYVPHDWMEKEGQLDALNRREVLYYNVQLGSRSELEILADMIEAYQKTVIITLNSLTYEEKQYPKILDIIKECMELGFYDFIIADPALLLYIRELPGELREKLRIHLSGECGEINDRMIQEFEKLGAERIIFHRKTSITDMKQMIQKAQKRNGIKQFEAFVMNELCQFHGGFCNSLHCDELIPACRIPYRLQKNLERKKLEQIETEREIPGKSGCGLCALWKLRDAGVEYLKLVGRGNYSEDMVRDIQALKQALACLSTSASEEEYIRNMKKKIFPDGCSGNCYYR